MIRTDSSLELYQKQIEKNKNWKPLPDERRFTESSVNFHRTDVLGEDLFDKYLAVLKELGMEEYPAACLIVALYLEAEKTGGAKKRLSYIYNTYLKEIDGQLRNIIDDLIDKVTYSHA